MMDVAAVRMLNDVIRTTLSGCVVHITPSILHLPDDKRERVLAAVRSFSNFNNDNDPYKEHDMGMFVVDGTKYMWRIDYYDSDLKHHSPDPSNPFVTTRVITIMRADDY